MILAIDQGTTGTTCLVVDEQLRPVGRGYREIVQHYPEPGWVEHDPEEIWASVLLTAEAALAEAGIRADELSAVGITNQRETTVVWERRSGRPVHPAIVWQDRRTAARCAELPAELIRERTGLVCDPYFSATKLEWILARTALPQRELAFGTIDSWLAWKLTGGSTHVTDVTNASRTMLLDLETGSWDDELLDLFSVDRGILPEVVPSSGVVAEATLLGATVPLAGMAGDQQAALFGQALLRTGPGEGDVRHRDVRPRQHRGARRTAAAGLAEDCRRRCPRRSSTIRDGGLGARRRGGRPMAAGRSRDHRERCGDRDACPRGRLHGRRLLRAGADRARGAVLGRRCAGADLRPDARDDAGTHRAGDAGGDRPSGRRRDRCPPDRGRCAAGGRWCDCEQLPHAVPGGRDPDPCRAGDECRCDGPRCRRARRVGGGCVERHRRARAAAETRAAVRARHEWRRTAARARDDWQQALRRAR